MLLYKLFRQKSTRNTWTMQQILVLSPYYFITTTASLAPSAVPLPSRSSSSPAPRTSSLLLPKLASASRRPVHLLLHLGLPQLRQPEGVDRRRPTLPPRQPQLQPAPAGIASPPAILLTILFQTKSTHKDGQPQNCAMEQSPSGLMRSGTEECLQWNAWELMMSTMPFTWN
jgi:hypothetical protein